MRLWDLQKLQTGRIDRLDEGLSEAFRRRLLDLGFSPGEPVECLRVTPFGAPRVYRMGDSVFSLPQEIAQQVWVAESGGLP